MAGADRGAAGPVRLTANEALTLPALLAGSLSSLEVCQRLKIDRGKAAAVLGTFLRAETRGLVRPDGGRWALTDAGRAALEGGAGERRGGRGEGVADAEGGHSKEGA